MYFWEAWSYYTMASPSVLDGNLEPFLVRYLFLHAQLSCPMNFLAKYISAFPLLVCLLVSVSVSLISFARALGMIQSTQFTVLYVPCECEFTACMVVDALTLVIHIKLDNMQVVEDLDDISSGNIPQNTLEKFLHMHTMIHMQGCLEWNCY